MTPPFAIAGRPIGPDYPPYVVAELSGNHNGDIARALKLIEMAKAGGADAVKLQTYTADTLTIDHAGPDFQLTSGLWAGYKLYDLYKEAHTPWEWHAELFAKARDLGIHCFSTPFDATAVEFLENLDAPAHKIASFEMVDLPLIRVVASTCKPTIMSTGMASPDEIDEAVETFRSAGGGPLMLLHCISAYPAPAEDANLRRMPSLGTRYGCAFGLSDHTMGNETAIAAVALGARLVEKHVTLARSDGGPDAAFSLESGELENLCKSLRTAFSALGHGGTARSASEAASVSFRRSIYVVHDMVAGETFTPTNTRIIRPGYGLPPREFDRVIGKRAKSFIPRGTALHWSLVD